MMQMQQRMIVNPRLRTLVLEGKILNQLIHQINPKRIAQTNFQVKHKVAIGQMVFI